LVNGTHGSTGKIESLGGADVELGRVVADKLGHVEERLGSVERPNQSPLFDGGVFENFGGLGNFFRSRNFGASAVEPVLPMMERALDVVADDLAHAQIGAEMAAICVHDGGLAVLAAVNDRAAFQEVAADYVSDADFIGARDRIPGLMEPARGFCPLRCHQNFGS
jgi:hypothetical protein